MRELADADAKSAPPVRVIILCSFITYVFVLIAHERILHDVSNVHDAAASNDRRLVDVPRASVNTDAP